MAHHTSILLLLLAIAPCSVASTVAMARDTTATCSLSFTYTKDNTETKVIVGAEAMMRRSNDKANKEKEFHAELSYVSIARDIPTKRIRTKLPENWCKMDHYLTLEGVDEDYHDTWEYASRYGKRATEGKCKEYIKDLGTYKFDNASLDDEWKKLTIAKSSKKESSLSRGFFQKDMSADEVNKALFAIAHEVTTTHTTNQNKGVTADAGSRVGLSEILSVHMTEDGGKVDVISSSLVREQKGNCVDNIPIINRGALKVAQGQKLPPMALQKKRGVWKYDNVARIARALNNMDPQWAEKMGITLFNVPVNDFDLRERTAVEAIHFGLTGRAFSKGT
ncbi:hypothetical protein FOZ60_017242 [Perkinsus olseni]|uniref:Uncharacterized protein n=1 Tax=Perkinsus olseni TaxID=32597 RepID=A0A7J6N3V0_PEROL|nr:hypothetical protein FOZ60_017242 [Perkinsus olseni]